MRPISLIATASSFPERVVTNEFFGRSEDAPDRGMFSGMKLRHHMAPGQTAVDLIVQAVTTLQERVDIDISRDTDIILTNVSMPDLPFTGCGAEVAKALGARPSAVYDIHNHGCISFLSMMSLAQSLISSGEARTALICNVQTAAGRIFGHPSIRSLPQSAVPGDGCGVALIVAGDQRPVEHITVRCVAENASDMEITSEDGRHWWEPGDEPFHIDFSRSKVARIVQRGNRLVPDAVQSVCRNAGIKPSDADIFISNQPNRVFLRNWREALQIPAERHIDTFEEHGNLFGAGMPVCLDRAQQDGHIKDNSLVLLGGFSHAGDYAGSALIRWNALS